MRTLLLLLLTVVVYACDRAEDPRAAARPGTPRGESRAASYDRSFFLLSRQADTPVAAILDFSATESADLVRHTAGAWLSRDGEWLRLLEDAWDGEPMREPWRLVPHGALRLIVGEGGEIESLVHRADSAGFRLLPSAVVAEWGVGDAQQFRLRRGELRLDAESVVGVLLDLQTGAPISQAGEADVVFVTDGAGAHLIVARGDDGRAPAWLYRGADALTWDDVTLTAFDAAAPDSGAVAVDPAAAAGWRIQEPTGDLRGELVPSGEALVAAGAADTARTVVVQGWIEARGERRSVFGLLRYGGE